MTFQLVNPVSLIALIFLLPIVAIAYLQKKRHQAFFSNSRFIMATLGIFFCVLGLSRPQLGKAYTELKARRSQVVIAIDISKSMLVKDIVPTRLDFAIAFATQLLQRLGDTRVALYPFTLDGYLQIPFTLDSQAVIDTLSSLNPKVVTNQGTDLERSMSSLYRSLARIHREVTNRSAEWLPTQVVLLSDGESHYPVTRDIGRLFKEFKVPIFSVGIGTELGGTVAVEQGGNFAKVVNDSDGIPVMSKLNVNTLKQLSNDSGGEYFAATIEEVEKMASKLDRAKQVGGLSTSFKVERELFPLCFLLAFCLFLIQFGSDKWEYCIRLLIASIIITVSQPLEAKTKTELDESVDDQTKATILYNEGVKALKHGDGIKASDLFQNSASLASSTSDLKKRALFNLADILLKKGDPEQALEVFQQAYDITVNNRSFNEETNKKISENMALAYKIMQRTKQNPSPGEGDPKEEGPEGQDTKGPKKFRTQNFSEAEKKKLFDLVASEEQESLSRIQSERGSGNSKEIVEKPW